MGCFCCCCSSCLLLFVVVVLVVFLFLLLLVSCLFVVPVDCRVGGWSLPAKSHAVGFENICRAICAPTIITRANFVHNAGLEFHSLFTR